jgi:hypothetical protein
VNWTEDKTASRPTFVMDADPRYTVMQWGLGSWQVYYHGNRINPDHLSLGNKSVAMAFAEAHYSAPEQRIARAVDLIGKYANTDGAHHKQWVLNKVVQTLTGGATRLSDEGIAP